MMTRMIELFDTMTGDVATVPVHQVADQLRKWIDEYNRHLNDERLADEFQAALLAKDFGEARDLAAELAVGYYEVRPSA